jgi:hypothetical protein
MCFCSKRELLTFYYISLHGPLKNIRLRRSFEVSFVFKRRSVENSNYFSVSGISSINRISSFKAGISTFTVCQTSSK